MTVVAFYVTLTKEKASTLPQSLDIAFPIVAIEPVSIDYVTAIQEKLPKDTTPCR